MSHGKYVSCLGCFSYGCIMLGMAVEQGENLKVRGIVYLFMRDRSRHLQPNAEELGRKSLKKGEEL